MYDNEETSTWSAEILRPDLGLNIDHIHKYGSQGGRVLDFGCYSGKLLARLDSSYKRYGVETNRAAALERMVGLFFADERVERYTMRDVPPPPARRFPSTFYYRIDVLLRPVSQHMLARPGMTSVPGNDRVSADHLLIVLARKVGP